MVAAVAALPDAAVITRARWENGGVEIVAANPAFVALTGRTADELAGSFTRILHGSRTELPARAAQAWHEHGEGWLHRRDDSAFYATWKFQPVGGARPEFLIGVYRDRSEVHQLQEALLHSQKLDTVGQLAGSVAHDFNNLLSVINGYCEIMSGKLSSSPDALRDLEEIHRAGQKASTITRQILEFSRRQETEPCVVNANALIREIAGIIGRVVGDSIKVELRLASDLGNMRIDPTQFQQVLLNLCFNARDAMPKGGKLTVRTSRRDAEEQSGLATPGWVIIEVTDTGAGMTPAVRRRIFEPFFTTKARGTGFGLATVLAILQRAGGAIDVRSTAGSGTAFELRFPETPEPAHASMAPLAPLPAIRGSETIWLVEADETLRRMVAGILTIDGFRVSEFGDAGDLLAALPAPPPAVLVIDAGASQAPELARAVRARNGRLCVVNVSGETPAAALPAHPPERLAHLPKPFALSALLRAVRGLLDEGR